MDSDGCCCDVMLTGDLCDRCAADTAILSSQDGHVRPSLPTDTCLASCMKPASRDMRRCDSCMTMFHTVCIGIEGLDLPSWVCPLCADLSRRNLNCWKLMQQLVVTVNSAVKKIDEIASKLDAQEDVCKKPNEAQSDPAAAVVENGELRALAPKMDALVEECATLRTMAPKLDELAVENGALRARLEEVAGNMNELLAAAPIARGGVHAQPPLLADGAPPAMQATAPPISQLQLDQVTAALVKSVKSVLPPPPVGQSLAVSASLLRDLDPAKLKSCDVRTKSGATIEQVHELIQKWLAEREAADEAVGTVYLVGGGNSCTKPGASLEALAKAFNELLTETQAQAKRCLHHAARRGRGGVRPHSRTQHAT